MSEDMDVDCASPVGDYLLSPDVRELCRLSLFGEDKRSTMRLVFSEDPGISPEAVLLARRHLVNVMNLIPYERDFQTHLAGFMRDSGLDEPAVRVGLEASIRARIALECDSENARVLRIAQLEKDIFCRHYSVEWRA
ncbi:MAG: hypothetical protein AB1778_08575 [Candidatus Bipolaricaulota bacterium]